MNGLALSRDFFEKFGEPMLRERFPDLLPVLACGLCGSGSECFGLDDELSRDHDFEPGFCIFIPGEEVVDRQTAFRLERAYASLPREFDGLKRELFSPAGGARRGVVRYESFFEARTGSPDGRLSLREWLRVPEFYLAEAVNGEVFRDDCGVFSDIRASLSAFPRNVLLKRLAGTLVSAAQAGVYNYERCEKRCDSDAARYSLFLFAKEAVSALHMIKGVYTPYYKLMFRSLGRLGLPDGVQSDLSFIISGQGNFSENRDAVERILGTAAELVRTEGVLDTRETDPGRLASLLNDAITDNDLRNMNILAGV
ncbi:MAG: DUF4037 domain-containing protein [Clostridia bacterium]|nr:DUF4037 domain-containing protein [Clostridia bacterium]